MRRIVGFTLIELLVVLSTMGILTMIVYPSYLSYMLKTRRGEAKTELIKAQLKQTSLHILNPSYSNDKSQLGLNNSEYYLFTIVSASTTTYSMKAVAQGIQSNDTTCLTLSIDQNNNKLPEVCW